MIRNTYGLDLGTYEIKIYDNKSRETYRVKDAIAIQNKKEKLAIGDEAYEMYEKTPPTITVEFPMKNGVISRFDDMQYLLNNVIKGGKHFSRGSEYVIAVPTDVTEVEKRAFYDLVIHSSAKAKKVSVVDRGIADAIGFGLDVVNAKGIFVVNFGAETTELSVISSGGIMLNKLLKHGASNFDTSIQSLVRHKHDLLIGRITAESIRTTFGVFDSDNVKLMSVSGRNLITGVPQLVDISFPLVRTAIKDPLLESVNAIRSMLDRTPPDALRVILENGIYITGGMANLSGIETYLSELLGLKVTVANNPQMNTIKGISKIIVSKKDLKSLTYSMLDENYRWMR